MLRSVWRWLGWAPPQGDTLQERYPAAPGVPTFTYSSVDLPEEAFAPGPRVWMCPWCETEGAFLVSAVPDVAFVVRCRHSKCGRISRIQNVTEFWGPETKLV